MVVDESVNQPHQEEGESDDSYLIRTCRYCQTSNQTHELEQLLHCDGIWLHALRFFLKGRNFDVS